MRKNKAYCTDENWSGRTDCKHCAIRSTVLFSVLSEAELEDALREIDNQWVEAGSELFFQDTKGQYVYTVRSGCVKMVHEIGDGSCYRIVRLHYRGDTFGLEALLGEPYRHSAIVLQKADICRIPVSTVQTLRTRNLQLYKQLILRWQATLDEAEHFLVDLNTGHAESRLARLLLKLDAHNERHLIPDLLREDIAAIIGVTTETASRLMADFRRRKLVCDETNRQMRCDPGALKSLI
jgi:CRP/FNR family transcriptional regulator, anaerobic regulatory protein